ncbi:MAG: acyl-CoA thioesterase [Pseudomonadales bacterium]|uniref:Thioesterase family protein domain protein n=1 Tax=Oleiphilus messinensis TaxID=141451 RepID=A0A1Y0IIS6_9GAMM|nr:thioesterase family protein [Oleiphilus messinensis]ARU59333.1 thioesterase family protein domain protein [Oleiphilus messinensis]MCG8609520.1 acyl-CoA thioesterase [Pseudomonadales bacterium]
MAESMPANRDAFKVFYPITTRWMDNDIYGHVNNVTYYSYFDSAVNRYLIEEGGLDIQNAPIVGYVVNSSCQYRAPIAYPDQIEVGIRVNKLGNSSVTYGVAIFKMDEIEACAYGDFVHVFVDRAENRAVPIPGRIREALTQLQ